jgi:hypothetical protein
MELRPLPRARTTQSGRVPLLAFAALAGVAALVIVLRLSNGSSLRSGGIDYDREPSTSPKRSPHVRARDFSNTTTKRSMDMLIRYFSWLAVGLAAVFLVIASAAFTSLAAIAWLTFGISIGTLVVSVGVAYRYRNHLPTLVTAIVTAVVTPGRSSLAWCSRNRPSRTSRSARWRSPDWRSSGSLPTSSQANA